MANRKITELATGTALADADLFIISDEVAVSAVSRSLRADALGTYIEDFANTPPYFAITSAETGGGVTPSDYSYPPGNVFRYGATGDGIADDYDAFNRAISVNKRVIAEEPPTNWKIGTTLTWTRSRQRIEIYGDLEYTGGAATALFKMEDSARAQVSCYGWVYGDGTNYCVLFEDSISNRFFFNRTGQFDITFAFIQAVGGQAAGDSCTENIIEYNLMYGGDATRSNYGVLFRNTTGDAAIPCEGTQLIGGFLASMLQDGILVEANTNAKYLYATGAIDFCGNKDYNVAGTQQQSSYLSLKYIRPANTTLGDGDVLINLQNSEITINSKTLASQCFTLKAENGTAQALTGFKYIGSMEGGDDGTEEYTTVLAGTSPSLNSSAATNIQAYYKPGTTATPASTEAKIAGIAATFRRADDASAIQGGLLDFRKRVSLNTVDAVVNLANAATPGDKFIIKGDGGIGVSNTVANTNTPSGATSDAMPIYDEAGTLVGYIPIYAAQW